MPISTVTLLNTFLEWMAITNQSVTAVNDILDGNVNFTAVHSNTIVANSSATVAGINVAPTLVAAYARANGSISNINFSSVDSGFSWSNIGNASIVANATSNVAKIIKGTGLDIEIDTSNGAIKFSTQAYGVVNTAFGVANGAYDKGNTAQTIAVSAFAATNVANTRLSSAYDQANTARDAANTSLGAFAQANIANSAAANASATAVAAFAKANSITYGPGFVIFTSSSTFDKNVVTSNTNSSFVIVETWAGGGAGGAGHTAAIIRGAGGGGGEYAISRISLANLGFITMVNIGLGGTAATNDPTTPPAGGNGGNTDFGGIVLAVGGKGAAGATGTSILGGLGGTGGTGDWKIAGQDGGLGSPQTGVGTLGEIVFGFGGNAGGPGGGQGSMYNVGQPGAEPGGAGSGGNHVAGVSGKGANGACKISWT